MTERAKKIYRAWEEEWVKSKYLPNHEELALASAIREIANCFEWDSYGLAELNANDFIELADEVEELANRRAESRKSLDAIISLEENNCDYFDDYGETTRE